MNQFASEEEPRAVVATERPMSAGTSLLAARARADIEARALIAMHRPRNVDTFREKLLNACRRTRFAEAALYDKPVSRSESVTGLSIRFAEEAARHYQNLDIATFLMDEDDEKRLFEVVATDLENNLRFAVVVVVNKSVERRFPKNGDEILRTRKNSKDEAVYVIRAVDDDLLLTKQSALLAKAQREVILKHLPSDIKEEALDVIQETLRAEATRDPDAARKRVLDLFYGVGVSAEQLDEFLGHPLAQANAAEVALLRRVYQGMKQEGVLWSAIMETKGKIVAEPAVTPPVQPPPTGAGEKLKAALR